MTFSSILKCALLLVISFLVTSCGGSSTNDATTSSPTNSKPIAVISPAVNQTINVGDTINFRGDNSSDNEDNTSLTYLWSFSGNAASIKNSTLTNPGDVTFSEVGTTTVSLIVKDSLGLASDETSVTITIKAVSINQAPTGNISHDNGDGTIGSVTDITITEGSDILFDSAITDPENDAITYAWHFQGAIPVTSTSSGNILVNYATAGSFTVTLVATDTNGNSSTFPNVPLNITVLQKAPSLPAFKSFTKYSQRCC